MGELLERLCGREVGMGREGKEEAEGEEDGLGRKKE